MKPMKKKDIFDGMLLEMDKSMDKIHRTLAILQVILNSQPIGISRISESTGLPEHIVRYSLRVMQKDGIIEPSKSGAIVSPVFLDNRSELINRIGKMYDRFGDVKRESDMLLSSNSERRKVAEKESSRH